MAIVPERRLNNGQPQLHAHLINQAAPGEGEHVVHVGTGTGYYTAIMAHMVGAGGRVTGIEIEPALAEHARAAFAPMPNVTIVAGDGATVPFDPADVIYVNAGTTRPEAAWLDALKDGGRLILPLTTDKSFAGMGEAPHEAVRQGAVLRIVRRGDVFDAKWISAVAIFPCAGARDAESERALAAALANGRLKDVTRLYRGADVADKNCWLRGPDWCLAYA